MAFDQNQSSPSDLDEIQMRLAKGVKYSPEEMRGDILYLLRACADLQEVMTTALENPEKRVPLEHATVALLQKHLRQSTTELVNQRETNRLMQETVTNLQKWLRERHLWTDPQIALLKTVAPAELREFLEAKKAKPLEGASD